MISGICHPCRTIVQAVDVAQHNLDTAERLKVWKESGLWYCLVMLKGV